MLIENFYHFFSYPLGDLGAGCMAEILVLGKIGMAFAHPARIQSILTFEPFRCLAISSASQHSPTTLQCFEEISKSSWPVNISHQRLCACMNQIDALEIRCFRSCYLFSAPNFAVTKGRSSSASSYKALQLGELPVI